MRVPPFRFGYYELEPYFSKEMAPFANKSANHNTGFKLSNGAISRIFNVPAHSRIQEKNRLAIAERQAQLVWSKYWSEASISSIENLIALITVPVPHRRPG